MTTRSPRLLVFDLDGTLIDSVHEIQDSVNRLRDRHELPHHSLDRVRAAIGDGARVLLGRLFGDHLGDDPAGSAIDELLAEFLVIYRDRSLECPRWMPGARAFLDWSAPRYQHALLTNKPQKITEPLVDLLELRDSFAIIGTPERLGVRKPDPMGLESLLQELEVERQDALLIGDSETDFATGVAAGVTTIGLRGGYYQGGEPEPTRWLDNFDEFRRWLEQATG